MKSYSDDEVFEVALEAGVLDRWLELRHVQRGPTGRTYNAPVSLRRTLPGHVAVARTFGRGTDADDFEPLAGAPVGCPESLAAYRRRTKANARDLQQDAEAAAHARRAAHAARRQR